jgi:hypothetical protein
MAKKAIESKVKPAPAHQALGVAQQYKKLKAVTMPTLKIEDDQEYYIKILSPITQSTKLVQVSGAGKKTAADQMEPPKVITIINLDSGEEMQMVCNAVLVSELNSAYPNDKYIGKCFCISKYAIEGKRYKGMTITEVAAI